jgi:dTDP-4-dehydrorhamnose reductase
MKILIVGASGMLGNALFRLFSSYADMQVFGTLRNEGSKKLFEGRFHLNLISGVDVEGIDQLMRTIEEVRPNVVINCIGLVKQFSEASDPLLAIPINSLLPHRMARICSLTGARFIHLSTDCVFSGTKGFYSENDQADAKDLYGMSKYLGEVSNHGALTLRTSIIGHELRSNKSLINWFLSQNLPIKGYRQAFFSGLPTVEIGKIIKTYVLPNPEIKGLYHLSADSINKYDLLRLVSEEYKKNIEIVPDDTYKIDRSLDSTRFRRDTGFKPKSWKQLVSEMHEFR